MNDFLTDVTALVVGALVGSPYESITVTAESQRVPEEFPCITVEETSNTTERRYFDNAMVEDYSRVGYRISVYSNKLNGRRVEARDILNVIDPKLQEVGLLRTFYAPIPSMYQSTVYEIETRYEGVFSKDGVIYHN